MGYSHSQSKKTFLLGAQMPLRQVDYFPPISCVHIKLSLSNHGGAQSDVKPTREHYAFTVNGLPSKVPET